MIPEINKEYNHFDDGKIRETRRYTVKIMELIPFKNIDNCTLSYWKEEVEHYYWLYSKNTDYFIKGNIKEIDEDVIYIRTHDNGWFSMGYEAGRLDVDGSLFKRYN